MAATNRGVEDEDCVEYFVFPIVDAVDEKTIRERLEELADLFAVHLSGHLFEYIWQWESFKLTPVVHQGSHSFVQPHLYGRTRFGDNVEDEWFIVFLLMQLSKSFPDLVIRIVDNDGEFLLIEAADFLKKWMTPEACEQRVYVHQGAVHIIPIPQSPAELTTLPVGIPSIADAVEAVRQFSSITKADAKIQKAIQKKISDFPSSIKENHHRAHCYLPASAIGILQVRPCTLSSAVRSFYARDPLDMKACKAMKYFPPETRVLTEVTFTKCLYAQLMQQKFIPDKRVGWNLPPTNSPQYKAHELGMKLACGFEILAAQSSMASDSADNVDFDSDIRFNRYLLSLKEKGYFRGEIEHSKLYDLLLQTAKLYYKSNMLNDEKSSKSSGDDILLMLNSMEIDMEQLRKKSQLLRPPDDDGWLNVTPDQFDNMLSEHFNTASGDGKNGECERDLAESIPKALESFVSHVSSYEGAEFPTKRTKKTAANKSNRVTFDPESFADAMQSILDFKLPDWEEENRSSSSSMSDYSDEDDVMDMSKPNPKTSEAADFASEMSAYMKQMDRELSVTNVGQSFERTVGTDEPQTDTANGQSENEYKPINLELTALKNILESYSSQQGLPGPASNLLGSMSITVPQNADDDE